MSEGSISEVCSAEIGANQRGKAELRIGEVLAGEVPATDVAGKGDTTQVRRLVAASGVKLGRSKAAQVAGEEARPPHVRTCEIGAGQRGTVEGRIGEVVPGKIAACQVALLQPNPSQVTGLI